jgi:predicted HicB family RNase H-like nuclease
MPKMIRINLPDELHARLVKLGVAEGLSLNAYVLKMLGYSANRPSMAE